FLNSLPISLEVAPGTWRELIERVAEAGATSMTYRHYPVAKIQQDVRIALGEVAFNYSHFHVYGDLRTVTEHKLELVSSNTVSFQQNNFDFHAEVLRGVDDDRMMLALDYNVQVLEGGLIGRLGQYYVKAFEGMLRGLDQAHHEH